MDENELLLRHAERWASERQRTLDAELVGDAVRLRAAHDGFAANRWPARSVQHLMLTRWPSHGPLGVPDVPTLVASLDTFWRFLRSTGRMASGSAEPAALLKEAKQAAKKMPAACQDPAGFGASKSMMAFGAEIGISLDDLPDADALNERFAQIVEAWNALPTEERRRRSPGPVAQGSRMGEALTSATSSIWATGDVPAGWEMPATPRLDEAEPPEQMHRSNAPAVSAPQVRASGFVAALRALVDWVGDGRAVTATGVLRPAVAREAYEALDLWEWERRYQRAGDLGRPQGDSDADRKQAVLNGWKSAADCLPLARLWNVATDLGLIEIRPTKAIARPEAWPTSDLDWIVLGHTSVLSLIHEAERRVCDKPLLGVLFLISDEYGGAATLPELRDWWWESPANIWSGIEDFSDDDRARLRRFSDQDLERCLALFEDAGLWIRRRDTLVGTAYGWDAALLLVRVFEEENADDC